MGVGKFFFCEIVEAEGLGGKDAAAGFAAVARHLPEALGVIVAEPHIPPLRGSLVMIGTGRIGTE